MHRKRKDPGDKASVRLVGLSQGEVALTVT